MEPYFSLIIPAYDEEENLPILIDEVETMLQKQEMNAEIIFVNDGSKDKTLSVMREMKNKYAQRKIRILNLNGNYGLSAALEAGFKSATAERIVSIDADLQNDPADIPKLLAELGAYDAVIGVRIRRQDGPIKRISSRVANGVRNLLTGEKVRDTGCTLKAFKREFVQNLKMFTGMHRFLPSLLEMQGAKVLQVEVNHRPRIHGKSKYYLRNRLVGPLLDLFAIYWMKKRNTSYKIEED